ncbi:MAG TPA: SLBB domain-containing protein [Gemmatimonadaceae bacterium]|nr:SLBB domain-containing protein [Gemmatimonadaceae bacterium]
MTKLERIATLLIACTSFGSVAQSQTAPGALTSRAELSAAEASLSRGGTGDQQKNSLMAAAIRQRLRDGDFQVGDRVVVTVVANDTHTDTLVVRTGRVLELPARLGKFTVPLTGVLRSELQARVETELLKYVRAQQVVVTPLIRVGILGEVAHPGYFAFASDLPITDAIMGAGGPSTTADVDRSLVRRGNQEYRSAKDTRQAIASGLTLDQFGLSPGDVLIVGRRREFLSPAVLGAVGVAGSLVTIFLAVRH